MTIGARPYSKDPTILGLLAPKVIDLAQRAIFHRENPLSTLQAFLLLTVWPMPVDTMHKDISPVLAGAMLNLAVTVGLHVHGIGQDFSRTTLHPDANQKIFRTKLWLSCLIASQRYGVYLRDRDGVCRRKLTCVSTAIANGLPPPIIFNTYDHLSKDQDAFACVPIELRFRRKLSQNVVTSTVELGRTALSVNEPGGVSSLRSMIDVFLLQLSQLDSECPDRLSESRADRRPQPRSFYWQYTNIFTVQIISSSFAAGYSFKASTFSSHLHMSTAPA